MFKHYGKYAERFVRTINSHGATEKSRQGMMDIGRYMRSKSYEFNNEHPNNDSILRDMQLMAGSEFNMDLSEIASMRSEYRPVSTTYVHRRKPQRTGAGGNARKQHMQQRGNKQHRNNHH